jgi:ribosome-binding protein aMBF1 (putative translation factor)
MQAQEMIRTWINGKGLKFSWVAAQVPVKPAAMSRWMNGRQIPDAVCRARLSEITGIDLRDADMWGTA